MSIRLRLILHLLALVLVMAGGASGLAYLDIRQQTGALIDAQLARSARLMASLMQAVDKASHGDGAGARRVTVADVGARLEKAHDYETGLGFQIVGPGGRLLLKSANMPDEAADRGRSGFSNQRFDGEEWRLYSLTEPGRHYRFISAERVDVRNALIHQISADFLVLSALFIPALLFLIGWLVRHDLQPLHWLAGEIDRRDSDSLDALADRPLPREVRRITDATNNLLHKLRQALQRERRITSDAAHELRTPLAAIRLHAELARSAASEAEREASLLQVTQGIDRTTRLVEQLLALARLEADSAELRLQAVCLASCVSDELAQMAPLAEKKNIALAFDDGGAAAAKVMANELGLALLVRNLLSNAINYTQPGGRVTVSLAQAPAALCLQVEDNGPGIAVDQRDRVMARFCRGENHDNAGCGIGLSIVSRVAEMSGARVSLEDGAGGHGLRVRVCFPRSASS